jgi:penicillin-binding protein 2
VSEANSHRRLVIVGVLVVALFAGLLTRLWFLQVNGGEKLAVAAQRQRDRFVSVPAVRGTIYDDKGDVLAQDVPVTTLMVDRQKLSTAERAKLVKNLSAVLFISPDAVNKLIDNPNYQPFESVPVATVNLQQAVYVMENRDQFPEVSVSRSTQRQYPNGTAAADILGYLGQVNQDDLKARQGEGYQPTDAIGKTGVEQMFESELRGTPGEDKVQVDNQNRQVGFVETKKPEAGHDVHLTVDLPTQQIAEQSLQQGIDGAKTLVSPDSGNYYPANAGAVVVLDARTGSVVAMASNPTFNPNDFISGKSDQYFQNPDKPLINRALNPYAPGSTFKTFTSIALLQNPGLFPDGPNTTYSDYPDGCFHAGAVGEKRCNAGGAILGSADLPRALTVSSDVYFYNVGNEFWKAYRDEGQNATGNHNDDVAGDKIPDAQHPVGNGIQHTDRTYGFGESTGIGLGGDAPGVIPDHEYRVKLNADNPDNQIWRRGDSESLAVGQGDVLVTPLQLANAYAAFANGGTLYQPRVAVSVTDNNQPDKVVSPINPIVKRTTNLNPDVRNAIVSGLTGVVHDGGTAAGAFNDYQGIDVIGKTGTAQRSGSIQDTSWFAGITNPQNDPTLPQYVVVAMVEQGGFGASVAAPIVRRVIDFLNNPMQTPADVVVAPAVTTLEKTN